MGDDLTVVNSARVSFGVSKQVLDEKDKKLINYLAKHKHFTPFEHCSLTVLVECPLYIRSQIMRHRTFSYNEISRRYTSEDLKFYLPEYRTQHKSSKQCSAGSLDPFLNDILQKHTEVSHQASLGLYSKLIDAGVAREQARGVLPQNLMTSFWMSGNLRNFSAFLSLRLDEHAQEEVRLIAEDIKAIIEEKFPIAGKALMENLT